MMFVTGGLMWLNASPPAINHIGFRVPKDHPEVYYLIYGWPVESIIILHYDFRVLTVVWLGATFNVFIAALILFFIGGVFEYLIRRREARKP